MSRKVPVNISNLTKDRLRDWIKSFDIILSDCDSVLWKNDVKIEGSDTVINRLIELGKRVYFVTNNSTKTRDELVEKARNMNYNVDKENIISTPYMAARYLKQLNFQKKVYVVGPKAIAEELEYVGIPHCGVGPDPLEKYGSIRAFRDGFEHDKDVGAVFVGYDEHISFPKMMTAAAYLANSETLFIGTSSEDRFSNEVNVVPGPGAILKCIEVCSERKALVMGKPSNFFCEIFFKNETVKDPERYLMIGDNLKTDILFGNINSYQTLLVETGVHNMQDVNKILRDGGRNMCSLVPDFYVSRLGELLENYCE